MNADTVRELFRYNRWANRELLAAVEGLDAGRYTRDLGSSFRSVRDTVVHVLSSEWLWAERFKGVSPQRRLDPRDFPDTAALRPFWDDVEADHDAYLARLGDADLARPFAYINPEGERWEYTTWQCLLQCLTHSGYHRGQVVTLLRQLGALPVGTDLLTYYDVGGGTAPRGEGVRSELC